MNHYLVPALLLCLSMSAPRAEDCSAKLPDKEVKVEHLRAAIKCLAAENAALRQQLASSDKAMVALLESKYVSIGRKVQLKSNSGYLVGAASPRREVQVHLGSAPGFSSVWEVEAVSK